jgi:hypothetical protein
MEGDPPLNLKAFQLEWLMLVCGQAIIAPDSAFFADRIDGSTRSPSSDSGQMSRRTASASFESGTSCGRRIFISSPGVRQTDFAKLISGRRMSRTSPGRVMVSERSWSAARSVGHPVVFVNRGEQGAELRFIGDGRAVLYAKPC